MKKVEKEELERLGKERARITSRMYEIETAERRIQNAQFVGKYYRYRNSYGDRKGWWLYMKVLENGDTALLPTFQFQITSDGTTEISTEPTSVYGLGEEITASAFAGAWKRMLAHLGEQARKAGLGAPYGE